MNYYASVSDINNRMISVYNNMFLAVVTSMLFSLAVASSPGLMAFLFTGVMKWIVIFAPLVMILAMTWIMQRATYGQARGMLHVFAALMGYSNCVHGSGHLVCDHEHLGIFYQTQPGIVGQFLDGGPDSSGRHQHRQCVHWQ